MEKLRQGPVLHLGVKGVYDDDDEGKIIFPVTGLSRQILVPAQPPGEGMSRSTYANHLIQIFRMRGALLPLSLYLYCLTLN